MMNIIILSEPRTGSSILGEIISSFTPTRMIQEYIINQSANSPHINLLNDHERSCLFKLMKVSNVDELVQSIKDHPELGFSSLDQVIQENKIIKIHDYWFEKIDLNFIFELENTKFVLIDRSSKIEQYVSEKISFQLNRWNRFDTSNISIQVDIPDFLKFQQRSEEWSKYITKKLEEYKHDYLHVNYEQDLKSENFSHLIDRLEKWLNQDGSIFKRNQFEPRIFKRQNYSLLSDRIKNYSEIESIINPTGVC